MVAREQLAGLFDGGLEQERNIVSALVATVTGLVVQELLEVSRLTSSVAGAATSAGMDSRRVAERV